MKSKISILNVKPGDLLSIREGSLNSIASDWINGKKYGFNGPRTIVVLGANDQHIKLLKSNRVFYVLKEFGPKGYRARFSRTDYNAEEVVEWEEENKTVTGSIGEWIYYVGRQKEIQLDYSRMWSDNSIKYTIEKILRALASAGKGGTSPLSNGSSLEVIINHMTDVTKKYELTEREKDSIYNDIYEDIRTNMLVEDIDLYKNNHIPWKDYIQCFEKLSPHD